MSSARAISRRRSIGSAKILAADQEAPMPPLFNLQKYHVVLGRYNRGVKTKALTPGVKLYKKIRDRLERGENLSQLPLIKHEISLLLQEELGYPEPPPVTFWVDVHKAEKDGHLGRLMEANPQLRKCKDYDGEEVVFVQDHEDFFLKADLAGHKKRRGKAANPNEKSIKKTKSLKLRLESVYGESPEKDGGSRRSSVTSATRTMTTNGSSSNSSQSPSVGTGTTSTLAQFQIALGSELDLEDEVDKVCCQWILQEGPAGVTSWDTINRKTTMVQTLKSYVSYFRDLLLRHDPCGASSDRELQRMNEGLLVQVVNTLGNSMMDWYDKHPTSCLPGEANAWNEELSDEAIVEDSENGAIDKGSVGTYEVSEEDEELERASRHLSEFNIGEVDLREGSSHRESWRSAEGSAHNKKWSPFLEEEEGATRADLGAAKEYAMSEDGTTDELLLEEEDGVAGGRRLKRNSGSRRWNKRPSRLSKYAPVRADD